MKKLVFALTFVVTFFTLSAVSASAVTNDTVKVGLRYGSSAMFSANLENAVGSGYTFGWYDEDRSFHDLGETEETTISMTAAGTIYLDSSGNYSASSGSRTLGPWHAQIDGFDSYEDALDEAQAWNGGYPAWIDGEFAVRVGCYESRDEAEDMAAECGGDAVKSGSTGVMVTVTRTTQVLFEFDCGGARNLGVQPDGGSRSAVTWFKGYKYQGGFEYPRVTGGNLNVINVVDLESYVQGVLPYEMSGSWPLEALKAQAVCARTYAALQVLGTAYEMYHADVDDTTDCQVYLPENANAAATEAVYATAGQILTWQGMIASIYYFSTSCGYTTGLEVWQQEALPYLGVHSLVQNEGMGSSADIFLRDGQVTAYDSESRFFRWRAVLQLAGNEQKLRHALQTAASHRDGKVVLTDGAGVQTENLTSFGTLADLGIDARSESGCVTDLRLTFENGIAHVYNENAIRNILWSICTTLTDKNGNSAHNFHMLPSAFFSVDTEEHGIYVLYGGGLGHGIGMSQYGADGMAKSGKGYVEILGTFFPGTELYTGAGK